VKTWSFDSPDPETTRDVAAELGRSIGESGLVIGLIGPLGAGKTEFVKGLADGLGVDPALVSSPTFAIAQQYPICSESPASPTILQHVDFYRLDSEAELESTGFFDLFEVGAVVATEWADRFPGALGPEYLEIGFEGPSLAEASAAREGVPRRGRRARVVAHGPAAESALQDWCERIDRASRLAMAGAGAGVGSGPQRSATWLLMLALAIWGMSRLGAGNPEPSCSNPDGVELDVWGTRRVVCRGAGEAASEPRGVGGLLFGHPIALDRASRLQLEALPDIGPSRARAIIAARDRAPFEALRDLERVPGIGPKIRGRISSWLELGTPGAGPSISRAQAPALHVLPTGGGDRG
jgi:tRNA threonylcarbamoyladenosine biosynthesis protein TsaE